MTLTVGSIIGSFFTTLSKLHAVPSVPTPFPDRLAKLDPALSTLDNGIYNAQTFDWSKSGLDLLNPARVGYFMDKLHRYVSSLEPGADGVVTIVDLGCGAGIAIEAIHAAIVSAAHDASAITQTKDGLFDGKHTYKLIGIDLSPRSIETARQKARARSLCIEYIVGDIYHLPFPHASVDAIICSDVLEHLFDLPAAFASISASLKPNAIFTFDTINRTPASYYLSIWILQDLLKAMQGDAHDHRLFVTPDEAHAVMQRSGLSPGPESDLVGLRPGVRFPPAALYRLTTGAGFIMSILDEFQLSKDLSISYLHWCRKVED